jgi:transcriptional regulator with XRE-family HTH domain
MSFGDRLRELRTEKELRQEDLGKIVGVVKSTVSQWESGERTPDASTLLKLADFFKVSIDFLLDLTKYNLRDEALEEWNEVIKKAINYGINPEQVKTMLDIHWKMAKKK